MQKKNIEPDIELKDDEEDAPLPDLPDEAGSISMRCRMPAAEPDATSSRILPGTRPRRPASTA